MGLGVMGMANAIEACGHLYGGAGFLVMENEILRTLTYECYAASIELAREKGPFPLFDSERYLQSEFIKNLDDEELWRDIALYGIRNSHLTSIAPTGTISLCADNVSGGIEPVFAYELQRQINAPTGPIMTTVKDYGVEFLNIRGKLSADVTAEEHINVLATAQDYMDSAVSKTINMTSAMPWEDFKAVYKRAWELGCKGCTTFNQDGKRMALLVAKDSSLSEDSISCFVDPNTGQRDCS